MKKRLLSLVLCLVMVFSLLPMASLAVTGDEVAADGTYTGTANVTDSSQTDTITITVTVSGGNITALSGSYETWNDGYAQNAAAYLMNKISASATASVSTVQAISIPSNASYSASDASHAAAYADIYGAQQAVLAALGNASPAATPTPTPTATPTSTLSASPEPSQNPTYTTETLADGSVIKNPNAVTANSGNLNLSKTLSQNASGAYDITMESYSTADVSTVSFVEKVPTDFVIIVDQSGSMATTDMATGSDSYSDTSSTVNLETAAKGDYYYYDSATKQFYHVYGKRGYLYYRVATSDSVYADDLYGTNLFYYWSDASTVASGAYGYYYYHQGDDAFYPIRMSVEGTFLGGAQYRCTFSYNRNGTSVNLPYSSGKTYHSFRMEQATHLRLSLFSDKLQFAAYKRNIGYTGLYYRDVNGVEHPLTTTSNLTSTRYCAGKSNSNAVTTLNGSTRMLYSGLYTRKSGSAYTESRLSSLETALNEFATALAAEQDSYGAVDNRVAIVGFSSQNSSSYLYNNTEVLTGATLSSDQTLRTSTYPDQFPYYGSDYTAAGTYGTNYNGPQYFKYNSSSGYNVQADSTTYANALISASNGTPGTVNSNLTKAIKSVTAYGGTEPEYGFYMAKEIFNNRSTTTYTMRSGQNAGTTVNRNKIVIFFTDGRPGNYAYSDQYEAANAVVAASKEVKDLGVSVFSIGVFSESDGNPLTYRKSSTAYSSTSDDAIYDLDYADYYQYNSNSYYYLYRCWLDGQPTNYGSTPNDTIYDYMSVVSSNYPSATSFIDDSWNSSSESWINMTNRVRGAGSSTNNYYRMASNQNTLVAAFEAAVTNAGSMQQETTTVTISTAAVFKDTVNTTDFDVSNATYTVSWQPIQYTASGIVNNGNAEEKVSASVPVDGAISYSGFDYAGSYVSSEHTNGYKLVVKISGLTPKTVGTEVASNVGNAGIYAENSETPVISITSPLLTISSAAKTYVIDFNAPMTVAMNTTTMKGETSNNGAFTKTGTDVTYKLKGINAAVGQTSDLKLSGVDTAMVYGVPANSPDGTTVAWNKITTVPASSVYFDDDLQTAIAVGDGSGYNVALENSNNYIQNETRWDNDDATQTYYFTFNGTGADVYATTEADGAFVQAALFRDENGVGADACVTANRVGGNVTMKQYSEETRYNVPTLHFVGDGYGTYTIRIKALKGSNFRLDGIRVYNAMEGQKVDGEDIYKAYGFDQEANASFFNLRELLINNQTSFQYFDTAPEIDVNDADQLMPSISDSILYVDDADGILVIGRNQDTGALEQLYTTPFEAYKANSPKNEIYLASGQGIAFTIANYGTLMTASDNQMQLQVGLSVAKNSEQTKAYFNNLEPAGNTNYVDVKSPVDMYYTITPVSTNGDSATFIIKNVGSAVLAVTDLKVSGTTEKLSATPASGAQVLSVDNEVDAADEDLTTLQLVVNAKTLRALADIQVEGDENPANSETPEQPEVTPEPTPDQPGSPSLKDLIQQILSSFVQNLFKSIGRLFGN